MYTRNEEVKRAPETSRTGQRALRDSIRVLQRRRTLDHDTQGSIRLIARRHTRSVQHRYIMIIKN